MPCRPAIQALATNRRRFSPYTYVNSFLLTLTAAHSYLILPRHVLTLCFKPHPSTFPMLAIYSGRKMLPMTLLPHAIVSFASYALLSSTDWLRQLTRLDINQHSSDNRHIISDGSLQPADNSTVLHTYLDLCPPTRPIQSQPWRIASRHLLSQRSLFSTTQGSLIWMFLCQS